MRVFFTCTQDPGEQLHGLIEAELGAAMRWGKPRSAHTGSGAHREGSRSMHTGSFVAAGSLDITSGSHSEESADADAAHSP